MSRGHSERGMSVRLRLALEKLQRLAVRQPAAIIPNAMRGAGMPFSSCASVVSDINGSTIGGHCGAPGGSSDIAPFRDGGGEFLGRRCFEGQWL